MYLYRTGYGICWLADQHGHQWILHLWSNLSKSERRRPKIDSSVHEEWNYEGTESTLNVLDGTHRKYSISRANMFELENKGRTGINNAAN